MRCTKPFSATRLPRFLAWFLVVASLLTAFAAFRLNTQTATAATNNTLNFQARLMQASGAIVPDGTYNVEFKIYNAVSSSGSSQGSCTGDAACKWVETRTGGNKISVTNGYLTANLGSISTLPAIDWDQELWLTMNIGGTGSPGWDGEMSPRLKLTAVPYALSAGQLATTNGSFRSNLSFVQPTANRSIQIPDESGTICLQNSASCGFMTGSATDFIQNQNSIDQSANFRISGTGRANTSIMTPILQPTADGTTALKIQNIAGTVTALAADTTNGRITVGANTAAQETLDVVGNLQVRDAATATKSYRLRTSGGALDFEAAGANLVLSTWSGAGYTGTQYNQITFKSDGSSMDFARGFNIGDAAARVGLAGNVNPQYSLDVNGDINTSTQYRIGGTVICTASGCTPAAGSANYIQNQNSSDQTANFRIDGTGRAGTALQTPLLDTASAVALNIGTTNATAINLNKATVVTGALTQSGGAVSLTGNAASQIITTSNNALSIRAGGTAILTLNTSGAGTVNVGVDNTTTVNIGGGTDVARTIRVGDPQSAGTAAQTVSVGSQRSTSTTTIQGGSGTGAIALNTASGGNIGLTTTGTGTINLTTGSAGVFVKPTTDNGAVFQIQNAAGSYLFNVNSIFGLVNIGLLNIGIGTNTALIDTTNSGDTLTIGATNASTVNIGRTAAAVNIQGTSASTFKGTSGSFTTTFGFTTPTANRAINLPDEAGTVCLQGSTACNFAAASGSANYIQNSATVQSANFYVQAASSGSVAGVLRANAAGAGNILNLQNGAGTNVATFSSTGAVVLQNSTNSTGAFQVSTSTGDSVLRVDTTNERVAIGTVANPINAKLSINTASVVGLRVFQGGSSDAFQAGNGTADFLTVGSTGNLLLKPTTNSTTALQIQNATGTNVLQVDTANQRVAIGNTAPALKFEVQGGDAAIYNSGNSARLVLGDSATTGQYGWLQWDSANDYFRIETAGSNGLKIKDNFVSIGNIFPSKPLIVGSGTAPLFEVATTGQVQARTSTNSATAFQLQNDVSDVYFNADSVNKRIGIGDGNIAPEVALDVWGAIQQTGLQTPNTGATDNNKWTKLGSCTITAQYNQCTTKIEILGGNDGSAGNNSQATVSVRVKQQNALGGVPYVNVTLNDTAEVIDKADIVGVTTVNNGTTTTVELYGRITNTFEDWYYAPTLNTGGYGESTWNWSPFSAFVAALPAGTQTPARYGNSNANLLTVESTDAAAVHVQNAAGTQVFNIDTVDQEIMLGAGYGGKHFASSLAGNPFLELGDSAGNGVGLTQVESGNAYLTFDTELVIQREATNSTRTLQVMDAADDDLFVVNGTNSRILIGESNTTGTLLVLDTMTGSATDPTGVNGGMYYNSTTAKLRCYENSVWRNCNNGDAESISTVNGPATTALAKGSATTIIITPIYIPGRMTVNEMRVNVVTTPLGAAGDIGLYNSAGTLVLNGGSSSVTTGTGLKTVTPTQAAGSRIMEPGQYYMAVTWNATTGTVSSAALPVAGMMKRSGTIAGGGLVLPSSLTLSGITATVALPAMSLNN